MNLIDLFETSQVDPYVEFMKFAKDPRFFATYHSREIVDFNQDPKFDTPIGRYVYPLNYLYARGKARSTLFNVAPFASNKEHISLIKMTSSKVVDLASYSSFNKDFEKLENHILDEYGDDVWDSIMFDFDPPNQSQGGRIWFIIELAAKYISEENGEPRSKISWMLYHRLLKWDGAIDRGKGIIHRDEPSQAVFFTTNAYKVMKTLRNYNNLADSK